MNALEESFKYIPMDKAVTVQIAADSGLFVGVMDALAAMGAARIAETVQHAPHGCEVAVLLEAATRRELPMSHMELEFAAKDLTEQRGVTYRDWADLFADRLYDSGYKDATLIFYDWKEKNG